MSLPTDSAMIRDSLQPGRTIEGICPICGSGRLAVLPFRYLFRGRYLFGVSCASCSLTFVHPQPTHAEIASMYQEEYFRENSDEVELTALARTWKWRKNPPMSARCPHDGWTGGFCETRPRGGDSSRLDAVPASYWRKCVRSAGR